MLIYPAHLIVINYFLKLKFLCVPFDIQQKKQHKNEFLHWTCFYRFSFAKRSRHVVFNPSTEKKDSKTLFFGLQKYKIILIKRKFIWKYIWLSQYTLLNTKDVVSIWCVFYYVCGQVFIITTISSSPSQQYLIYHPVAIYTFLLLYNFKFYYWVKNQYSFYHPINLLLFSDRNTKENYPFFL